MSLTSYELFNIWFPALVGALVIGLVVAALWEFFRRRFCLFASKFRPGILEEVGLDNRYQSRAEAEDHHQEIIEKMNIFARVINLLVSPKSSNFGARTEFDIEAQIDIKPHHATPIIRMTGTSAVQGMYSISTSSENPLYPRETIQGVDCRPINIIFTSYFPDATSKDVTRPAKRLYRRHAIGPVKRIKSSIILQASIVMDPWVLAEIIELAKHCMQKENKCIFQLGNWAILYYSAGEVQLHLLKECDVPVNVEARWQDGKTGITMRGLHLTASQVKVGTKRTSKILRSAGPATPGAGDLDELHLPTGEFYVHGEDSLIYASKVVVVDGVSLIVRSEACFILPPREKNAVIEVVCTRWVLFSKMLQSLLFGADDCQPECAANRPELEFDPEQLELSVEHWKGLSQIELLYTRKEVLMFLQEQGESRIIIGCAGPLSLRSHLNLVRDEHYLEFWQEGLRVLNEVIHRNSNDSHSHTYVRVRGDIQFLLRDFESALQDYDLALLNTGGLQSTVLLHHALVKCMLGRYSEAMQDVVAVITLIPNVNDIQELQACLGKIIDVQRSFPIATRSGPSYRRPLLPDQGNAVVEIPDLLTGDEWYSGEIGSQIPPISDAGTAGEFMGVPRAADWSMTSIAKALKLQLNLTNYAQSLEMNPRYHVRRISFLITLLEDECDPNDVVNSLSLEDQELLNLQAPTEDFQDDLQVRETLISLSRRLLPYKNISHTLYSNVTDDDSRVQRRGPHPLSPYRHVSYRSAILTKHSAADGDVQTLLLFDGTAGDRSSWRRRSHEYIKLLVLPEAMSPYRAFWLVQWDVVDMRQVSTDGQGDRERGLCSNPTAVGHQCDLKQFDGFRLSEKRISPWIAVLASIDGNGLNRHRGSDGGTNPRMSILANFKPQPSCQSSSDVEEVRAPSTGKEGSLKISPRRRPEFEKLMIEIRPPRPLWFERLKPEDADRVREAIMYYLGSDIPYHFSDSLSVFAQHRVSTEYRGLLRPCDGVCENCPSRLKFRATPLPELPSQIVHRSGREPGTSLSYGAQFRPYLQEWVAEWKSVDKKMCLGMFDTEQAAARAVDVAQERKSVDNFHYHDGDEEAVPKVLRSADAHRISDNPRELPGLAHCGEEELTSWYQFHCLKLEHTTPRDDIGILLKEWNPKDESLELKIEYGLQVAMKRGSYHDLSRSTIEQVDVLAGITHPNVCKLVHQFFWTDTPHISIVMEPMEYDLRSVFDSRLKGLPEGSSPFTYPVAVDIMLQIVVGMLHCPKDVIHRDLKAKNILLSPLPVAESGSAFRPEHYYSVKLADFGQANSGIQSLYGETCMAGTSLYKAPEMLEAREVPLKIDVYSLGMVCYEILTGKLPFEEYRNQGLSLHAGRPFDNLMLRDVPEALKQLIHQCLDSNPALRPTFNHIVMKLRAITGRKAWDCNTSLIVVA